MCLPKILLYSRPPEGALLEESSIEQRDKNPVMRQKKNIILRGKFHVILIFKDVKVTETNEVNVKI